LTLTLKAANELRKAGLEVKVFEKREFVSTTWINPISGRL
jgi:hypothetical protein